MAVADTRKHVEQVYQTLQELVAFDPESLRRTEDLGEERDFSEAVGIARSIIYMHAPISKRILAILSDEARKQLSSIASRAKSIFGTALEYNPAKHPLKQHALILASLRGIQREIFFSAAGLYACAHVESFDLAETKNEIVQFRKEIAQVDEASKAALNKFRKDAGISLSRSEIKKQSEHFGTEANEHRNHAYIWAGVTFIFACLLVASPIISNLIVDLAGTVFDSENAIIAEAIAVRFVVLSAVGYLLVLSGKTYLSHNHNQVVNKHRHNALLTYEALANGATSEDARDAILKHAAACIYSPQTSGYAKGGDNFNLWPGTSNTKHSE